MTFGDLTQLALGNLSRMKLRAFLTTAGVVIAIGAFVAMLSFGAGMQENVSRQFEELGLFSAVQVYPQRDDDVADSSEVAVLDQAALERLASIPGVQMAFPLDAFDVECAANDTVANVQAQALPAAAFTMGMFSQLVAGTTFKSDSADEVLINESMVEKLKFGSADSALGRKVILATQSISLDSGLVHLIWDETGSLPERLRSISFDSLFNESYRRRVFQHEANAAARRFFDGLLTAKDRTVDTLLIVGVLKDRERGRTKISPVILPTATALHLNSGGLSGDPIELFAALRTGKLFVQTNDNDVRNYPQVTLNVDPTQPYKPIADSIEALGYRAFSYAEQFDEIKKFFLYFDMGLSIIGLIALVTASLGIVNTMIMSITERRREIGVMKSLGASPADIRLTFLFESSLIGVLGAIGGIILGWSITRLTSVIAQKIMVDQGIDPVELFALPFWLIGLAFAFGLIVSIIAGYYPASRAARVDPVEALRSE